MYLLQVFCFLCAGLTIHGEGRNTSLSVETGVWKAEVEEYGQLLKSLIKVCGSEFFYDHSRGVVSCKQGK